MASLAQNLRRLREALDGEVTCRELDRRAGLAEGHTAMIESGERRHIQLPTLCALAHALGVGIGDLIT